MAGEQGFVKDLIFHLRPIVCVSGGFDPLHEGHLAHLEAASRLGKTLVVILNGDLWLTRKKGAPFQTLETRIQILESLRCVDVVYPWDHVKDDSVVTPLYMIKPDIFAKGGDRVEGNTPEVDVCQKNGIRIVYGVGGTTKPSSSSVLLKRWVEKSVHGDALKS